MTRLLKLAALQRGLRANAGSHDNHDDDDDDDDDDGRLWKGSTPFMSH